MREQKALELELSCSLPDILRSTRPPQGFRINLEREARRRRARRSGQSAGSLCAHCRSIPGHGAPAAPAAPPKPASAAENGRFIRTLDLERFRPHPALRDSQFGTVNLIRGVNGTGKTSLLEAIELAVCGGIRRQEGTRPENVLLKVHYQGAARAKRRPSPMRPPTALATSWYGGYRRAGNDMCRSFARFNFFDLGCRLPVFCRRGPRRNAQGAGLAPSRRSGHRHRGADATVPRTLHPTGSEPWQAAPPQRNRATESRRAIAGACEDSRYPRGPDQGAGGQGRQRRLGKLPAPITVQNLAALQESVEEIVTELEQYQKRLPWLGEISIATLSQYARALEKAGEQLAIQRKEARINQVDDERKRPSNCPKSRKNTSCSRGWMPTTASPKPFN